MTDEEKQKIADELVNGIKENIGDNISEDQLNDILSNVNNYSIDDLKNIEEKYGLTDDQIKEIIQNVQSYVNTNDIINIIENFLK